MSVPQPSLSELIIKLGRDIDVDDCALVHDQIAGAQVYLRVTYACKTCRKRYYVNVDADVVRDAQLMRHFDDLWAVVKAPFDNHSCHLELGPAGRP